MLSKQRNRLLIHKRGDLRLYLIKMSLNISKLCGRRQAHPSHLTGDRGMYGFPITAFKNTTMRLLYQAWGATMMCRE